MPPAFEQLVRFCLVRFCLVPVCFGPFLFGILPPPAPSDKPGNTKKALIGRGWLEKAPSRGVASKARPPVHVWVGVEGALGVVNVPKQI